ncbi:folate-binding Fe-S cluster repair protein YgfZ [Labrenzia sp. EL_208]|nr:folate-binding Fe-S cluster repair protein YgfZ [Labrenzia sp. EL_132]MBG6233390.1 folate-binding Fe-S cluster repair protein YgfZ [Labrenzia sp. EL_208]
MSNNTQGESLDTFLIAKKTDFRDADSVVAAMEKMAKVSEAELDRMMCYKLIASNQLRIKTAISLATLERERRAARATEELAFKTTRLAGWIGIIGALIGAAAATVFAFLLQFWI